MAAWVEDVLTEVFATHSRDSGDRPDGRLAQRCVALLRRGDDSRALLRLLAGAGPDLRDAEAKDRTLLIHAARYGRPSCAGALLEAGASVHSVGADGGTALHSAAYYGHGTVCELLLRADAPLATRDRRGETPADSATAGGHDALARRIQRAERGDGAANGQVSPTGTDAADSGADPAPELWVKVEVPPRRVTVRRGAGRVFVEGAAEAQPRECFARLDPGLATVGRDPSCALRLRDASVSSQHAALGQGTAEDPPAPLGCHYGATMVTTGAARPVPTSVGEDSGARSPTPCGRLWVADLGSRHGVFVGGRADGSERGHVWQRLSDAREPSPWHPLPPLPARIRVGAVRVEMCDVPPEVLLRPVEEEKQQDSAVGRVEAEARGHNGRKRGRPDAVAPPRRPFALSGRSKDKSVGAAGKATARGVATAAPPPPPPPPPPAYRDRAAERRARHGAYSSLDAAIRDSEDREGGQVGTGAALPPQSAPPPASEPRSTRGLGYREPVSTDLAEAAGTALASGNRRSVVWARTALRAAEGAVGADTGTDSGAAPTFVSGGWQRPK